ncbi:hypothetical protein V2G26_013844 [Clonostachys chloroleuca]
MYLDSKPKNVQRKKLAFTAPPPPPPLLKWHVTQPTHVYKGTVCPPLSALDDLRSLQIPEQICLTQRGDRPPSSTP